MIPVTHLKWCKGFQTKGIRGHLQDINLFSVDKSNKKYGLQRVCKPCKAIYDRKWISNAKNKKAKDKYNIEWRKMPQTKARRFELHLIRNYGLPLDKYIEMFHKQSNQCPVCNVGFSDKIDRQRPCVDHFHFKLGKEFTRLSSQEKIKYVRNIICKECNKMLGKAGPVGDDVEFFSLALIYLKNGSKIAKEILRDEPELLLYDKNPRIKNKTHKMLFEAQDGMCA